MNARAGLLAGAALLAALGVWAALRSDAAPQPGALRPDAAHEPADLDVGAPAEAPTLLVDGDFPTLEATTPEEVRAVVAYCRAAGIAELPTLRRVALESRDPLVSGNALRALGRLGAMRPSDPELAALLDDPRPRVRQEAVIALGESGDPASVALLAPLLAAEPASLRPLVLQALGRIGTGEARAALEGYAPAANDDERPFLRAALEQTD